MPEDFDPPAGAAGDDGGRTAQASAANNEQFHNQHDEEEQSPVSLEMDEKTGAYRFLLSDSTPAGDDDDAGEDGGEGTDDGSDGALPKAGGQPGPDDVDEALQAGAPKRVRTGRFSEDDQAALTLMDQFDLTMADAMALVQRRKNGGSPPSSQAATPAAGAPQGDASAPPQSPPASDPYAEIDAEIQSLVAQRKEAADDADVEKALEIQDQIHAAQRRRDRIDAEQREAQARQEQAKASERQTLTNASYQKALRFYPDMGEEGSPMAQAFDERYQQLAAVKDPIFYAANWPELLAHQVAADLRGRGQAPAAGAPAQNGGVPANPRTAAGRGEIPGPLVTPAPAAGRSRQARREASAEEIMTMVRNRQLPPDAMEELLNRLGTPIR